AHIKDVTAYLKLVMNPRDELSFKRIVQLLPGVGGKGAEKLWKTFSASPPTPSPSDGEGAGGEAAHGRGPTPVPPPHRMGRGRGGVARATGQAPGPATLAGALPACARNT